MINITSEDDIPTTSAIYQAGSLIVQEVTDERGIKAVVYMNERGEKVMTKTQLSASPGTAHTGWLCTYYIYDEMGHLRYVLPPKATEAINNTTDNWNLATNIDVIDNLCYGYWYDIRNRLTVKHIPGKGKTYIAYDLWDRVVLTQDENLRVTNQWNFVKYDAQSRPLNTGLITLTGTTAAQVQSNAAASTTYPTLSGTYTILSENYYDNYSWTSGTPLSSTTDNSGITSTNFYTTYNSNPEYAQPLTQSSRIRGSATGAKKLIIGTSTYLYTAVYYDEEGRSFQTKQTNISGGTDVATTQFSYSGLLLRSLLQHQKSGAGSQTHTALTKYTYDHAGRLKTLIKNIDNTGDKTLSSLTYNELGQTSSKIIGSNINGTNGETKNFSFNIQGMLTGINKDYVNTANATGSWFGEILSYDFGFGTAQYNGNIAGVQWKGGSDGVARAYGYTYDNANRITKADFSQQNTGATAWTKDLLDFSVSGLKYDANGNITKMNQRGVNINTPLTIDSLSYTYFSNSNQLSKIKDNISDNTPWGDFKDTTLTSNDYVYDDNGNMLKDNNKHIHTTGGGNGITYNFLDKASTITVNSKGSINYTYDAAGILLQKNITDNTKGTQTVITYIAGFVYQKVLATGGNISTTPDTLQYALHEEGRIRPAVIGQTSPSAYFFDYFLKDHLGNIRSTVTEERKTDAYPLASLETANIATEKNYYSGLDNGIVDKSTVTSYPTNDTYTSPNNFIQKLNGNGTKIGAGILLKVMAGDKINVHASSWYKLNGVTPGTPVSPLTDIISALTNSIPGASSNKILQAQLTSTVLNPSVSNFVSTRDATGNTARPNAWLNIIVLDEQMNLVNTSDGKNSYFEQVGAGNTASVKAYNIANREITKSGYVYINVSNETPNVDVYWDNLQVTQNKGPLLQENGFYPFGLEMAAIGSQAASGQSNSFKFNAGTELETAFDVDYYETAFRKYDAAIGRFNGIDILSEQSFSITPYQFGYNNPLAYNDPTGALTSGEFNNIINALWGSSNGGHWSANGGGSGQVDYGGGSISLFGSSDEAFGFGAAYMSQNNMWGGGSGWAGSFNEALSRYSSGGITAGMVQGYYTQRWAGSQFNVSAGNSPNGKGFNITSNSDPVGTMDNVLCKYTSYETMMTLFGGGYSFRNFNKGVNNFSVAFMASLDFYMDKSKLASMPEWLVGKYGRSIAMEGAKDYTSLISIQMRRLGWQHGGRILQEGAAGAAFLSLTIDNTYYYNDIIQGNQNFEQVQEHYDDPTLNPMFWIYKKIEPWLISLGN